MGSWVCCRCMDRVEFSEGSGYGAKCYCRLAGPAVSPHINQMQEGDLPLPIA